MTEREIPHPVHDSSIFSQLAVKCVRRKDTGPSLVEVLLKFSTAIHESFVKIRWTLHIKHGGQMRRLLQGGEQNCDSGVRTAEQSDLAVAVWQSRRPFDCVVPVPRLVLKGIPVALRGVATSDVLHDGHIAMSRDSQSPIGVH